MLGASNNSIGHPLIFLRTASASIVTALVIIFTLQIIQKLQRLAVRYLGRIPLNLTSTQFGSLNFLSSLVNELVIVLWTLAALFLLAQWQADRDAFRDAVNETSRLPVVTAVIREENAALGRNLDNPLVNPSNFRVIGDRGLYEDLLGRELTDPSSPEEPLVWRLLIDRDGYFFRIPMYDRDERVLV